MNALIDLPSFKTQPGFFNLEIQCLANQQTVLVQNSLINLIVVNPTKGFKTSAKLAFHFVTLNKNNLLVTDSYTEVQFSTLDFCDNSRIY